jgi:hypothetical protein
VIGLDLLRRRSLSHAAGRGLGEISDGGFITRLEAFRPGLANGGIELGAKLVLEGHAATPDLVSLPFLPQPPNAETSTDQLSTILLIQSRPVIPVMKKSIDIKAYWR